MAIGPTTDAAIAFKDNAMRMWLLIGVAAAVGGCTIERIGPPGVAMTRPIRIYARDVSVFRDAAMVRDPFSVVDQVYVKDDGETLPRVLEKRLRELAGARARMGSSSTG